MTSSQSLIGTIPIPSSFRRRRSPAASASSQSRKGRDLWQGGGRLRADDPVRLGKRQLLTGTGGTRRPLRRSHAASVVRASAPPCPIHCSIDHHGRAIEHGSTRGRRILARAASSQFFQSTRLSKLLRMSAGLLSGFRLDSSFGLHTANSSPELSLHLCPTWMSCCCCGAPLSSPPLCVKSTW